MPKTVKCFGAMRPVGGYLSIELGQPAVAGEVLVGLIWGPSVLNFLQWPAFMDEHLGEMITYLAELGSNYCFLSPV